jgi:hypothetical protein
MTLRTNTNLHQNPHNITRPQLRIPQSKHTNKHRKVPYPSAIYTQRAVLHDRFPYGIHHDIRSYNKGFCGIVQTAIKADMNLKDRNNQ